MNGTRVVSQRGPLQIGAHIQNQGVVADQSLRLVDADAIRGIHRVAIGNIEDGKHYHDRHDCVYIHFYGRILF